eukprot:TRINITY_DN14955_c1_g4_i1.p1 TRINITY_DN14955_c1_g4~~TRINITY_DN14955_c1_g4_i1.p1  ORF type:complete len:101 (+),score=6.02 TRINITY_DN14955_c1_g4_i1:956-1258(+)
MAWSYLQHFVGGKVLREFLDGTTLKPNDGDKSVPTWSKNNSKVVNWILNSIEPNSSLSRQAFKKTSTMWNHLKNPNIIAHCSFNFFTFLNTKNVRKESKY